MSQQQVYDYLKEHPNSIAREISLGLNKSPQSVNNSLRQLMKYGCISRYLDEVIYSYSFKIEVYRYKVKE